MAKSLFQFRYPITRAYPYNWFPWAVYAGGICVIVLFSLLNFAANGYILTVHYTSDYNSTSAQQTWAQKLSFNGKVVATCQPQSLPVHSKFYTDKLSLVYELSSIWVEGDKNERTQILPSLQYANNPLQNCSVAIIHVTLDSDNDRSAAQKGWTPWGANALGVVTCSLDKQKRTWINITATYEYVTPEIESGQASKFVQPPQEKTALWWGESLLSWYWLNLAKAIDQHVEHNVTNHITQRALKGSLAFEPSRNTTNIGSPDFFWMPTFHYTTASYTDDPLRSKFNGKPECCVNPDGQSGSAATFHHLDIWPNAWIEADSFAKVFYSVILSDLGQRDNPTNLLASPQLLTQFSNNITSMKKDGVETPFLQAGPASAPYNGGDGSDLTIKPSVIFTEYLCQVPALKSVGSLILSVIVADLVFLNAAWVLLNWFAVAGLDDSTAHQCEGCAGKVVELGDIQAGVQV
ncbi:hypothetical protein FB567DRAFT_252955 [Paraphoma chrysanthemicola]|uniref:Uncharacterized protein n=1 Tax=Paraphoma chrysanthemicola TaxID=798071 RepID=A0A8K0QTR1_9PLEO|nr:hypothetical protein FB567DRAFT_252955 [Paraphoma chrysanthemicola]